MGGGGGSEAATCAREQQGEEEEAGPPDNGGSRLDPSFLAQSIFLSSRYPSSGVYRRRWPKEVVGMETGRRVSGGEENRLGIISNRFSLGGGKMAVILLFSKFCNSRNLQVLTENWASFPDLASWS